MQPSQSKPFDTGANGADATSAVKPATKPPALKAEFQKFTADVEDLVKASTSLTGEELARARARLFELIATARRSMERLSGEITTRARLAANATDDYVHEQPWKAIGIGAAAGLLLGVVLARRR